MPPPKDPTKYAEFLDKLSKSHKGKKHSPVWIANSINGRMQKSTFANKTKGKKRPPRSDEWSKNISLGKIGGIPWNKGKRDFQKLTLFRIRAWFSKLPMRRVKRKTPIISEELLQKKINLCKNRIWNEESLKKISLSKIGKPRPEHVRQAMLKASIGRVTSEETRKKISIKMIEIRKNWKIPFIDSKPERMMQIALALNGIKFIKHKPFKIGKSWHQVDLFIEPNIVIEVDGVKWHIPIDRIKRDLFINQEFTIMGYHVIRIRDKDILKNTQNCAEKVIQLIKELQYRYPLS